MKFFFIKHKASSRPPRGHLSKKFQDYRCGSLDKLNGSLADILLQNKTGRIDQIRPA